MKKIMLYFLVISGLLCANYSLASTDFGKLFSSQHPKPQLAVNANLKHPPLDVTVINLSSAYISVIVPGEINDWVAPGNNDHLYSYDPNLLGIELVLRDPYRNVFFDQDVCRFAVVTVYGYPGSYRIVNDMKRC